MSLILPDNQMRTMPIRIVSPLPSAHQNVEPIFIYRSIMNINGDGDKQSRKLKTNSEPWDNTKKLA